MLQQGSDLVDRLTAYLKTVAWSIKMFNIIREVSPSWRGGGGGGYFQFFFIRPASNDYPQIISGVSEIQKKLKFCNPRNIPNLYLDLKCIEMTPTIVQFRNDLINHPQFLHIEIQNFEPPKWSEPTYVWKYLSTPTPPPPPHRKGVWSG